MRLIAATALALFSLQVAAAALPAGDITRLSELRQLSRRIGDSIWAGWHDAPEAVLLIGATREYLLWHPAVPDDFGVQESSGFPGATLWSRPRQFDAALLATFPAVGGVPTIVVGVPAATGLGSTAWLATLLHEHFHQMQMSRPDYYDGVNALGLSGGDPTGIWMLNYPFPYDDPTVGDLFGRLARVLADFLGGATPPRAACRSATKMFARLQEQISPADYRYLMLQLWQEGVARYVQYRALELWRDEDVTAAFAALDDYQPPSEVRTTQGAALIEELRTLDLAARRRVSFYPVGATWALLLDRVQPAWKDGYFLRPFSLPGLPAPE